MRSLLFKRMKSLLTLSLVLSGLSLAGMHFFLQTTGLPRSNDTTTNKVRSRFYRERVDIAVSQCYGQEKKRVIQVYEHDKYKLAYCKVPKIGCTFWQRMFLFLNNETGETQAKTPFQIPRHFVHFGKKNRTRPHFRFSVIENQIQNYSRFMFTRNPYERLWSVYLDKFRLPDFWGSSHNIRRRINVTSTNPCGNDLKFVELLQYVASQKPDVMNEHWQPVSYRCDPCIFKPTFIGKMETFTEDAKYILRDIGYEWVLTSFNYDEYVEEELIMLTDYNFDLLNKPFYHKCLSTNDLAVLLWNVFQLNGYLPDNVKASDAMKNLSIVNQESFKNYVIEFYKAAPKEERHRWKLQKRKALKDAFRSIPKSITDKLISVYKDDFTMFGYDTKPPGYVTK